MKCSTLFGLLSCGAVATALSVLEPTLEALVPWALVSLGLLVGVQRLDPEPPLKRRADALAGYALLLLTITLAHTAWARVDPHVGCSQGSRAVIALLGAGGFLGVFGLGWVALELRAGDEVELSSVGVWSLVGVRVGIAGCVGLALVDHLPALPHVDALFPSLVSGAVRVVLTGCGVVAVVGARRQLADPRSPTFTLGDLGWVGVAALIAVAWLLLMSWCSCDHWSRFIYPTF